MNKLNDSNANVKANNEVEHIVKDEKIEIVANAFLDKTQETTGERVTEEQRKSFLKKALALFNQKTNVLMIGPTGVGKSTTVNSLFNGDLCRVGDGVDPKTKEISCHTYGNLTIYDTPGFGDSPEHDRAYAENIANLLRRDNAEGKPLIDLVLFVLDAQSRDMGTFYEVMEKVISPNLRYKNGVVIGLNMADIAMKCRGWDEENNRPLPALQNLLEDKIASVKRRIEESTNLKPAIVYYSALKHYNLAALMNTIFNNIPDESKIIPIIMSTNTDNKIWVDNRDPNEDQMLRERMKQTFVSTMECAAAGAGIGAAIGSAIPVVGTTVGTVVGGIIGGLCGFLFG